MNILVIGKYYSERTALNVERLVEASVLPSLGFAENSSSLRYFVCRRNI